MFTVLFSDTVRLAIRKITYAPERPLPKVSVVTYSVRVHVQGLTPTVQQCWWKMALCAIAWKLTWSNFLTASFFTLATTLGWDRQGIHVWCSQAPHWSVTRQRGEMLVLKLAKCNYCVNKKFFHPSSRMIETRKLCSWCDVICNIHIHSLAYIF